MINTLLGLPESVSAHGFHMDALLEVCHWFMLILFVGWICFFTYILLRFNRRRNPKAQYTGFRSRISTHAEVAVVVVEAVLLLGFAIPLWSKYVGASQAAKDPLEIHVLAEQFGWNYHYAGADNKFGRRDPYLVTGANPMGIDWNDPVSHDDIVARTDMHVPINRPVKLQVSSKDVIHNFASPHLRIAHDAIPGGMNPMYFTGIKQGQWEIICGQLCGLGHYSMKGWVYVDNPEDYEAWVKERIANNPVPAATASN